MFKRVYFLKRNQSGYQEVDFECSGNSDSSNLSNISKI